MHKGKGVSEKTKSNTKKAIRFFLSIIIFFSIGFVILNYVPFISKYDNYVIVTNSMEPVIDVNDIVVIDTSVKAEDLVVDEHPIIAFYVDDINGDGIRDVVVHYLYSVTDDNGTMIYRTVSESGIPDVWLLTADDIIGTHVLTIPKIGHLLQFTQSTIGRIVLIMDVAILYIVFELLSDKTKDKKDENSKNDIEEPLEES